MKSRPTTPKRTERVYATAHDDDGVFTWTSPAQVLERNGNLVRVQFEDGHEEYLASFEYATIH